MRYLLVDRIMALEPGNKITGVKNVAMSEDFLEFHFPKNPIMPGIMLLEALIQLSGWLDAASSDFRKWFLVSRVLKCSFYGFVLPGDQVELSCERGSSTFGRPQDLQRGCQGQWKTQDQGGVSGEPGQPGNHRGSRRTEKVFSNTYPQWLRNLGIQSGINSSIL